MPPRKISDALRLSRAKAGRYQGCYFSRSGPSCFCFGRSCSVTMLSAIRALPLYRVQPHASAEEARCPAADLAKPVPAALKI